MVDGPMVGRDEELAFVNAALHGGGTRGVVIAGGLGVGKTRLARESVAALDGDVAVEWVAATPGSSTIPFGALAHLVDDDAVGPPEDRLLVARSISRAIETRSAGKRLLLVVDDAHWLDPGAAAVVH